MTTNPEQSVLDDIDALVDWQLQQEASGYDHNINQPKCRCGEDWHALPITERLQKARSYYQYVGMEPDWYRYEDDASHTVCPGSETEGPIMACQCMMCGLAAVRATVIRNFTRAIRRPANGFEFDRSTGRARAEVEWTSAGNGMVDTARRLARARDASIPISEFQSRVTEFLDESHSLTPWQLEILENYLRSRPDDEGPTVRYFNRIGYELPADPLNTSLDESPASSNTEQSSSQRRPIRPPQAPPMWAVDPARSRRPRHERGHRRVR